MRVIGLGGGKEISRTSILKLKTTTKLGHTHGEVPNGDIGLLDTRKGLSEQTLVESEDAIDDETAPGEFIHIVLSNKQVAVLRYRTYPETLGY